MDTKSHKLTDARREMFYAELHALLTAGLDFSAAFRLLIEGEGDRRTKALLEELYAAVVRGETLAEAMRRSGAFRPLECGVVRIGNETGRLARTLDFLRDYYRKRAAQQRMVASAVSYPVVILAVAAAVVAFMLSVVVPMFEEVYARMGGELPALTRGIIALSKAFPAYAAVAVSAGEGLYLLYRANRQREEVQRWRAAILLRLPVAGEIIRKNMQAQCCKLLDLLCAAGVPLLAGVGMLREVIGFRSTRSRDGSNGAMPSPKHWPDSPISTTENSRRSSASESRRTAYPKCSAGRVRPSPKNSNTQSAAWVRCSNPHSSCSSEFSSP